MFCITAHYFVNLNAMISPEIERDHPAICKSRRVRFTGHVRFESIKSNIDRTGLNELYM